METRVYARYHDASALDATYLGTVNGTPETVAKQLRGLLADTTIDPVAYKGEVVCVGPRPF